MIRKAKLTDVKAIQSLVNQYADAGQMLPRTLNELYEHLRDFHVYEDKRLARRRVRAPCKLGWTCRDTLACRAAGQGQARYRC